MKKPKPPRKRQPLINFGTYSLEEVFAAMDIAGIELKGRRAILSDGRKFVASSPRMVLFRTKGVKCVFCDVEGSLFHMEAHDAVTTPHLNLYGIDAEGDEVLLTKDHIHPKSKGGPDEMENFQTMYSPCNSNKADKVAA